MGALAGDRAQSRPVPIRQPGPIERTCGEQGQAYLSLLVTVLDAQSVHGPDDGCQGLDGVAVDDRPVLSALLLRVAILVDDPGSQGARVRVYQARGPPVGIRSYGGLQ